MIDPPVPKDGTCALPGCGKQRRPERSKRYAGAAAELDPFCSTEHCRAWYQIPELPGLMERAGNMKGRPTKGIWKDERWDEEQVA